MLAVRVIPTLLMRGDKLVKGERFNPWRTVGVVEQAVRVHQARGVDELILLDVDATPSGRGPDFAAIERLTECCFSPITVGGGVRSLDDADGLLRAGADKVAIKSGGLSVVRLVSDRWGRQAVVFALDVRWEEFGGEFVVDNTPVTLIAKAAERAGSGEILLTSIDREGTMAGYDVDLIRMVSAAVSIPVIAHGGCSGPDDMIAAVRAGASAVAAGALFQFTDWTPQDCAKHLAAAGIEARVAA